MIFSLWRHSKQAPVLWEPELWRHQPHWFSQSQEPSGDSAQLPSESLQESAVALFSQEEKWPICRHASFKDYLSEASAFNRCTGGSEIVPTEPVGDHSGFTEGSALPAIEHVGAFSERHQHQLYGGDVLCMAGKSKECPQGAVCFHGYWKCILGKTLVKLRTLQPPKLQNWFMFVKRTCGDEPPVVWDQHVPQKQRNPVGSPALSIPQW